MVGFRKSKNEKSGTIKTVQYERKGKQYEYKKSDEHGNKNLPQTELQIR